MAPTLHSRLQGSLYGLVVGDALGAPYEFKQRGAYRPSQNMEPSFTFTQSDGQPLPAGSFTDDTSLTLCLAQSLNDHHDLVWQDAAQKMTRWYTEGYMSSVGVCFDIGTTTRDALERYEIALAASKTLQLAGSTAESSSGNGSLMRLAPIPVYFHRDPARAVQNAALQSQITHGSTPAVESCQLACAQMIGFLNESEESSPHEKKQRILGARYTPAGISDLNFTNPQVNALWEGQWKTKLIGDVSTSGFVIASHEAALWGLWNSETFEEGMLKLLAMGGDVDTVCAIYGQIAGACYGIEAIPSRWLDRLQKRQLLDDIFDSLIEGATSQRQE